MKPPSPCTGSKTIAATFSAATCVTNARSSAASASALVMPRYSFGNGTRYTSGANGPSPALYGCVFEVSVSDRSVRPWKPPSKQISAGRPVYARANLAAFSIASVPALKNAAFAGPLNGRDREQALGEGHADLVRDHREVGVEEARRLLLHGLDDPRMRVADVQAADTAREVDVGVAVDVGQRRAAALGGDDRQVERHRLGDDPLLPLDDRAGARPRHLGLQADRSRRGHGVHDSGAHR